MQTENNNIWTPERKEQAMNSPRYAMIITYKDGRVKVSGHSNSKLLSRFKSYEDVEQWIKTYGRSKSCLSRYDNQYNFSISNIVEYKEWETGKNNKFLYYSHLPKKGNRA